MFSKDIIKPHTAQEMVTAYKESEREIKEAYLILANAEKRLQAAFGSYSSYNSFDTVDRNVWWNNTKPYETSDKIIGKIQRGAWERIVQKLEIKKLMSDKRVKELNDLLKDGDLPEITEENIFNLLEKFIEDAPAIQEELFEQVFKLLRPPGGYSGDYKTNDKFKVGKKVILTWMVDRRYNDGSFHISYSSSDELNALDRVFHLLDGAGIQNGYQSPLVQAIDTCENGKGETDYFKFKCYKNRNLHIEFKRIDLVKELNRIAGGGDLPGQATQESMF